ncbi:uncharacterized protein B0H18DRAFT_1125769 [Fomitopsis serialis]|uniref:uncharacterized protein n=1 Tax=Fomitopsis serialis TaxID=139415 RepID=UPI0020074785|nr:uncharacterized protein B0H18DRAFT_1125769 [Neoantrodia serialis]KAH9914249.1 hypothetical protein B0H18DRAFT_1125769 [Neoantrodia serialis]
MVEQLLGAPICTIHIVLILHPPSRKWLFPPAPLAAVKATSGNLQVRPWSKRQSFQLVTATGQQVAPNVDPQVLPDEKLAQEECYGRVARPDADRGHECLQDRLLASEGDDRDVRLPSRLQRHIERLISLESESDYLRLQIEHSSASLSMLFMPQDVARQVFIRPLIDLPEDFTQGLAEANIVLSDINRLTTERRRLRDETIKLFNRTSAELIAANDGPLQPARNGIVQQHLARLRGIRHVLTTQREQLVDLTKKLMDEFDSLVATPKVLPDQAGSPINVVDLRTALQAFIDLCRGARAHSRGCDRAISRSEELLGLLNRDIHED